MFHMNACDGVESPCGCCDCTRCITHGELSDIQYDKEYEEWVEEQYAKELDKNSDTR